MASIDQGYDDSRFTHAVDDDLHCPICLNVLREPAQCQINEHHFCRPCITRHLKNVETCPSCIQKLSLKTLRKPARYLTKSLSQLEIRCDYENRGCREVVLLENLTTHVNNCEYAPVKCSNNGCLEIINKRDHMYHESQICRFRKSRCFDCDKMRKEVNQMNIRLQELKEQMLSMMTEVQNEVKSIKQAIKFPQASADNQKDIIIVGGKKITGSMPYDKECRSNSVERFSWSKKEWKYLSPIKEQREAASSVVYGNVAITTGGFNYVYNEETDTMEAINMKQENVHWFKFPAKLPTKCQGHRSLVYQDKLFVIGGFNVGKVDASDAIYEICLIQPFSSQLLCHLPQPRSYHAAICFGDSIAIAGGQTTGSDKDCIDSVLLFDVNEKTFTILQPLPFAVTDMASVGRRDSMILIGGINKHFDQLNTVLQYDVKTEESKMLPPMKHKRQGCTAVMTGNVIVVMGGYNKEEGFLDTTECFNFDTNAWKDLPSMNEPRGYGSAVVQS